MIEVQNESPAMSGGQIQDTWEVWNVTKEGQEFLVLQGLSESEAKTIAEEYSSNSSRTFYDEETQRELDADYEAREGGMPEQTIESKRTQPKQNDLDFTMDNIGL